MSRSVSKLPAENKRQNSKGEWKDGADIVGGVEWKEVGGLVAELADVLDKICEKNLNKKRRKTWEKNKLNKDKKYF